MEHTGVIIPVNQATAWISSYIIVESEDKKKKMHICLDPTPLNKAVLREPFYYCTPDDVYNKLAKATCFTVIDLKKKGYWQEPLDNELSPLTTFNTPLDAFSSQDSPLASLCQVMLSKESLMPYTAIYLIL